MSDLIDRQAAINAINARRSVYSGTWGKGLSMAVDILRDLPSAEPERKGKWIYHEDWKNEDECYLECSECGMTVDTNWWFCPKCGCRMGGEENG